MVLSRDQAQGSVRAEARAAMIIVRTAWKRYADGGKIIQKHRLTNAILDDYKILAADLKECVEEARRWHAAISLVGAPRDSAERRLHDEIMKECRFQWKQMQRATLIVSKNAVAEKLEHLPKPDNVD